MGMNRRIKLKKLWLKTREGKTSFQMFERELEDIMRGKDKRKAPTLLMTTTAEAVRHIAQPLHEAAYTTLWDLENDLDEYGSMCQKMPRLRRDSELATDARDVVQRTYDALVDLEKQIRNADAQTPTGLAESGLGAMKLVIELPEGADEGPLKDEASRDFESAFELEKIAENGTTGNGE